MKSIPKYHTTVNRAECSALAHAVTITGYSSVRITRDQSANLRGSSSDCDGTIKGMSAHALSRLRAAIANTAHKEPYRLYGLCLTIPFGGDAVTQEMGSDIWRQWVMHLGRHLDRLHIGLLYRVELQAKTRKAPHWHLMCYLPESITVDAASRLYTAITKQGGFRPCSGLLPAKCRLPDASTAHLLALAYLRATWCQALDNYIKKATAAAPAPAPHGVGVDASEVAIIDYSVKSWEYCFHAVALRDCCAAMGYLASHTSKHKQEQLGYKGKQWGFLGQKWLHEPSVNTLVPVEDYHPRVVVRAFRMIRHWCKVNRPHGLWKVVRPRRVATVRGDDLRYILRGLQRGNPSKMYLFGIPPEVFRRAFSCAISNNCSTWNKC